MKEKMLVTDLMKDKILKTKIKSDWSLGRLFYIMALLLPFFVCMLITGYFTYLYIFVVLLLIFLFWVIIYPMLVESYIRKNDFACFESVVLSCREEDIYYYTVEIEGLDGNFIEYRFPVSKKIKKGSKVIVVMLMGENKYNKYCLLTKKSLEVLTSRRTRFDLID